MIEAVKSSKSIKETLVKLGIKPTGCNYRTFHRAVERLNIDTSHFVSPKRWNEGKTFPHRRVTSQEVLVKNATLSSNKMIRRVIERENLLKYECSLCGLSEWRGDKLTLEIDHINGDNSDNRLHNLRYLCPNCHSQTPTWRGRNIKK